MTDAETAAQEGVQPETLVPGETIATEMPSRPDSEPEPAEPEAEPIVEAEAAATAESKPDDKTKPEKPPLTWQEKRRNEETNRRRAAEARAAELEAENKRLREAAAKPSDGPAAAPVTTTPLTPEQARAAARLELEAEDRVKQFQAATGRVLEDGIKAYPDFDTVRQEMVANFGEQLNARPDFFEALTDTDIPNGHAVFYELAKDPEQTERLLSMPPLRMAKEIARMSEKLAKPDIPVSKPISQAPAPVKPVGGAPQATDRLDDPNIPQDQFARIYLKQMARKGR